MIKATLHVSTAGNSRLVITVIIVGGRVPFNLPSLTHNRNGINLNPRAFHSHVRPFENIPFIIIFIYYTFGCVWSRQENVFLRLTRNSGMNPT